MVQDSDQRSAVPGCLEPSGDASDEHLTDVPDGCGCAEVWERLSSRRA